MKILGNYETDFVGENCTSSDLSASLGVSPESWTYTWNADNPLSKTQNFSFNIQNSSFIINYPYSPFGKITRTTGDIANRFAFRFSSEYSDTETGLVYYNYRYYSPELGRWLRRDPLEEYGGLNIYAMVGNNPLYWWDYLGFKHKPRWYEPHGVIDRGIFTVLNFLIRNGEVMSGVTVVMHESNPSIPVIPSPIGEHYNINKGRNFPPSIEKSLPADKRIMSDIKSVFHRQPSDQCPYIDNNKNNKYIWDGGHQEGVYDENGNLVTDPLNEGTYNFSSPDEWFAHGVDDLLPYILYGNSKNDPSTFGGRLWKFITAPFAPPGGHKLK